MPFGGGGCGFSSKRAHFQHHFHNHFNFAQQDPFRNPFKGAFDEEYISAGLGGQYFKNTAFGEKSRKRPRKATLKKGEPCEYDLCSTLDDLYNGKKKKMKNRSTTITTRWHL